MFGTNKHDAGKLCHETAFKKPCCKERCPKWVRLLGVNPQTGAHVDEYNCADTWVPLLLVEVSQKLVRADATIHNMNNELAKSQAQLAGTLRAVLQTAQRQVLSERTLERSVW